LVNVEAFIGIATAEDDVPGVEAGPGAGEGDGVGDGVVDGDE